MADWSMEVPAAVWMPGDLQLTTEPADAYALGIPSMEYACTDIFGSYYQTSISICDEQRQCGYEVATRYNPSETTKQESEDADDPRKVFEKVADNSDTNFQITKWKMQRYPASIEALSLDERYTTPTVVAIGPYYHECVHLKQQAEKMKYVAAYQCLRDSGYRHVEDMYQVFVEVAHDVGSLYDRDAVAGIGCDDFLNMMFFDACFLVQYMYLKAKYSTRAGDMNESLVGFFNSNSNEIFHDIMLLENQIPWCVVQTIIDLIDGFPLDSFISYFKGCLIDIKRWDAEEEKLELYHIHEYEPPHLLGLLRYYIAGRSNVDQGERLNFADKISLSVGANELAEIGIKLKPYKNTELTHMHLETNCILGGELFLAPVSLDDARVSCLLNMAAHELCVTPNFQGRKWKGEEEVNVEDEDSAVCSYLLLLAMLVAREEDVQELRTQHVLRGGGLANKDAVDFFTKLHNLRLGTSYVRIMQQIEKYQSKRRTRIGCYRFVYRNRKIIAQVVTFIGGVLGIIGAIVGFFKKYSSD